NADAAFAEKWAKTEKRKLCARAGDEPTLDFKVGYFVNIVVLSTTRAAVCGDGLVTSNEECDPANEGACAAEAICSLDCKCVDPAVAECCCIPDCNHPACGYSSTFSCPAPYEDFLHLCCGPHGEAFCCV